MLSTQKNKISKNFILQIKFNKLQIPVGHCVPYYNIHMHDMCKNICVVIIINEHNNNNNNNRRNFLFSFFTKKKHIYLLSYLSFDFSLCLFISKISLLLPVAFHGSIMECRVSTLILNIGARSSS